MPFAHVKFCIISKDKRLADRHWLAIVFLVHAKCFLLVHFLGWTRDLWPNVSKTKLLLFTTPHFFMVAMLPMNGMPGSYLSYTNGRFVDSRFCCHLNDFTVVMALIEPQINPFCSDEYMFSSYCFDDGRQLMKR